MHPLISIIVPIHNAEKYLKKCIESIRKQTYSNLEIILINDSSKDNSENFCKEFCEKDNRISFYNINVGSAGNARNFGIEKAKGKYAIFIDADDYIELNMCEKLYETILEYECDVCFCGYNIVDKNNIRKVYSLGKKSLYTNKQINDIIYNSIYVHNEDKELPLYAVWNGIYSVETINKNFIKFLDENMYFSEDSIFNYCFLRKCDKVAIIKDNLYNHTVYNSDSICNKYNERYNYIDNWYNYFLEIANDEEKEHLIKILKERYVTISIARIKQEILLSNKNIIEKLEKVKEIINSERLIEALLDIDLTFRSKKQKIMIFCMKHKLTIFLYILIKIRKK